MFAASNLAIRRAPSRTATSARSSPLDRIPRRGFVRLPATVLSLCLLLTTPASALMVIDFEQMYYVHPDTQVWDLCIVHHDGLYNLFYHGIPESDPSARNADHIFRSTSSDLIHWSDPVIVLAVTDEAHESLALWAPAVVYDDETGLWWMAYTSVDDDYNQRISMAWSRDLATWHRSRLNPVVEPDPTVFHYPSGSGYAECRDPFLYQDAEGTWNMLVSAKVPGMSSGQGVIARTVSSDLLHWSPLEVLLVNDGPTPTNTLESVQYHVIDGVHHVFFHEYATIGLSHVAAWSPGEWTFENRSFFDLGIAPEIVSFDGGANWLLTRIGPYQEPGKEALSWVARTDTLLFHPGPVAPQVHMPHPLARDFVHFEGTMTLGNPCFGDNPLRRGQTPAVPVGNFYFGSKEYFQGPLSGRGSPGTQIGPAAYGHLVTPTWEIQGNTLTMLVGGTYNPDHCFVALYCADTDTVIHRTTGYGIETMSPRAWDISHLHGRSVYLRIQDSDHFGYINVDEIREIMEVVTSAPGPSAPPRVTVTDHGPRPNPFNPMTTLHFSLSDPVPCRVRIHDLRGRLIWDSGEFPGVAGTNTVAWQGVDAAGASVAGGVYVYRIAAAVEVVATGKVTLLP